MLLLRVLLSALLHAQFVQDRELTYGFLMELSLATGSSYTAVVLGVTLSSVVTASLLLQLARESIVKWWQYHVLVILPHHRLPRLLASRIKIQLLLTRHSVKDTVYGSGTEAIGL